MNLRLFIFIIALFITLIGGMYILSNRINPSPVDLSTYETVCEEALRK